jgi:membrane protein implicated in regulation of membrane protease activity
MSWETFYLVCFLVGLFFSAFSLLGGMGRFGGHAHLSHGAHIHLPHVGHATGPKLAGTHGVAGNAAHSAATVPWWNAFSAMIFLCWFGAAGYLLTEHSGFAAAVVVALAAVFGVAGGAIIFAFLTRVLMPHDRELRADETEVVGAVGRVSSAIRAGRVGEIAYEQLGARRSAPARAEDGGAIAKEEEIFVTRYERGIAYVRRWEEVEAEELLPAGGGDRPSTGAGTAPAHGNGPRTTEHAEEQERR